MKSHFRGLPARLAALSLFVLATAGCDIAMADHSQKETAEWRRTYELQPGGRLELANVNGRIEVRPGTGTALEVYAKKIGSGATADAAKEALSRIEIVEQSSPSLVKIETSLPRGSNSMFGGGRQVEYIVRVPANVEVRVSTVNGGVEVEGLNAKVTAEATNGGVRARDIGGPIEATTTNGGVEVDLSQVPEAGVKLECTNGGIKLRLPSSAKASITARVTNGGILTNGLTLDASENSRRRLDARLNGGGPRIDLEGTNGGIAISAR
jgi:hypothetical protein